MMSPIQFSEVTQYRDLHHHHISGISPLSVCPPFDHLQSLPLLRLQKSMIIKKVISLSSSRPGKQLRDVALPKASLFSGMRLNDELNIELRIGQYALFLWCRLVVRA